MVQHSPYPVSSHYRPAPQGSPPLPGPAQRHQVQHQVQHQQVQPAPGPYGAYPLRPSGPVPHAPPARPQSRQVLMAGGSMLALAALVITPQLKTSQVQPAEPFTCIKQENTKALASRDQLKSLLEIELQSPKSTVQSLLQQPYCVLSPGKTEAGQPADREAYPLEFDPQTWLVVLYEGDRYAGYDFRFR